MSKKEWFPSDDFYNGYSLYQHLGYGPEGELNLTSNMLQKEGYPVDINVIKETLELTRDLANKIQETCESEIKAYEKITRRAFIVGGVVPSHIQIAKAVVIQILKLAAGKIRSLLDRLTTSEEERIINKIVDKLKANEETNEIIVKSTKTYRRTYQVIKKREKEGSNSQNATKKIKFQKKMMMKAKEFTRNTNDS